MAAEEQKRIRRLSKISSELPTVFSAGEVIPSRPGHHLNSSGVNHSPFSLLVVVRSKTALGNLEYFKGDL